MPHFRAKSAIQIDPNTRIVPLSNRQVDSMSDEVKHELTEFGSTFKYITCDSCMDNKTCSWAFDIYNTDGDCLIK